MAAVGVKGLNFQQNPCSTDAVLLLGHSMQIF